MNKSYTAASVVFSRTWTTAGIDVQYNLEQVGPRTVRLCFEGSASPSDWKHNFRAWVRPYKNMQKIWFAHAGFVELWHSVRDRIMSEIAALPVDTVLVGGCSLGGALALLAAEDCAWHGYHVAGNVYACPKVFLGSPAHIERFLHTVYVHNRNDDLVAKVPPWFTHGTPSIERYGPWGLRVKVHAPQPYLDVLPDILQ